MTTYTKLKTGAWGLRGPASMKSGETVTVSKKSGELQQVTVGKVIWTGNGIALATIAKSASSYSYSGSARSSALRPVSGCYQCRVLGRMCQQCQFDEFDD